MYSLTPKAVFHLSKLQRAVLQAKGVRYSISEEKGIFELLKYVQANRESTCYSLFQQFVSELTLDEKIELNLVQVRVAPISDSSADGDNPSAEENVVYYRGVKTRIKNDDRRD